MLDIVYGDGTSCYRALQPEATVTRSVTEDEKDVLKTTMAVTGRDVLAEDDADDYDYDDVGV
jgi:hypothetical protein